MIDTYAFMQRIFHPRSIVVIGVSERPDNLARHIIANLRTFGYQGDLYAVGRQVGRVHDLPIVASLDQVPDELDLAVILTPANTVPELVETCGRKHIQQIVIESGGFSEFSEHGRQLEEELMRIARRWGIRLVGPNCISVINLEAGLCLPFAPIAPPRGGTFRVGAQSSRPYSVSKHSRSRVSVIAQSGGISITYLDRLSAAGIGLGKVISIGNKADLGETDYLTYLLEDSDTEMICLYLESISDGRRLMELARSASKPIIVHKANRGHASRNIALSHTAALSSDDRIVDAAFRQVGILRSESFRDTVAMAQGLLLPPVRGDDLVIISRSGGHAVIAADAAERYGFRLAGLPKEFIAKVRSLFRADVIKLTNPLDLGTIFDFDLYAQIVEECLQMFAPDAVLLINTYGHSEAKRAHRLARRVEQIMCESEKPVALCVFSQGAEARKLQHEVNVPVFTEIEPALCGLAALRDWHRWLARSRENISPAVVPSLSVKSMLSPDDRVLTADRALQLCQAYEIPVASWEIASNPESAAQAADRLGCPVALKVLSLQVVHKTDIGGVALNLANAEAVKLEAQAMLTRVAPSAALMVQRMINGGVEVIVGGKLDPVFGPVIMFGLGGIYTEVLGDVTFRVAPLSHTDAEEMITEVRGRQLLDGVRGTLPADRTALVHALLAASRLMVENEPITELDINPLMVMPVGVLAVDARVVLGSVDSESIPP